MSKQLITEGFAKRLRQAMLEAGLGSSRSKSGVSIQCLAELTHHSRQMCRKYLSGEALPEPQVLTQLAQSLSVSPGWLLFGDPPYTSPRIEQIQISKTILAYILNHQLSQVPAHPFLLQLIQEISQLEGNDDQLKKIVDLAFSSANHFNI